MLVLSCHSPCRARPSPSARSNYFGIIARLAVPSSRRISARHGGGQYYGVAASRLPVLLVLRRDCWVFARRPSGADPPPRWTESCALIGKAPGLASINLVYFPGVGEASCLHGASAWNRSGERGRDDIRKELPPRPKILSVAFRDRRKLLT